MVSIVDIAAYLATIDFGFDINSFEEVLWFTEDASWYMTRGT
jgi:hypothetical protein